MTPDTARSTTTAEITWEDLLRLLVERPDWLARVRQVVLTPDLLSLPEAVRDLLEAQRETTFQIQELREVQRQTTEQIRELREAQHQTTEQIRELVEAQRQHEARLTRVEATVQDLVEAQRQTTEQIRELREAQHQTTLQIQELREAQRENSRQIQELREAVQELRQGLEELSRQVHELAQTVLRLTETVSRLEGTVGDIKGDLLEIKYRERPYAYFGRLLRSIRVVSFREIEDRLEEHLSAEEMGELLLLDLLLQGRLRHDPARSEVWLAVEVSSVVDKWDVERAGKRAALLRKAGFRAVPVAAGIGVLPEAQRKAELEGVILTIDGSISFEERAFQSALT